MSTTPPENPFPTVHATAHVGLAGVAVAASGVSARMEVIRAFDWDTAARGQVQMMLEEAVTLIDRSQLLLLLAADQERIARAIRAFFAELTGVDDPPRSVVSSLAGWLAGQVNRFVGSATTTAGVTVGAYVGTEAMAQLHQVLSQLAR